MPIGLGTAAAIGSVAAVGGGLIAASGAKSAANTQAQAATSAAQIQADAANHAADLQSQMFGQIRSDLTPYRDIGTSAIPTYSALLGLPSGGSTGGVIGAGGAQPDWNAYLTNNPDVADYYQQNQAQLALSGINSPQAWAQYHWQNYGQNEAAAANTGRVNPYGGVGQAGTLPAGTPNTAAMQTALENTPGYQFTKSQGIQAVNNSLAAKGLGGASGALGKGLARFVTGLADTTYQQQLGNYQGAVGIGQSAANQTGAFGQTATTNAGNALIGGANASAAGITGAAQAGAAGTVGAANSINSGLSGLYNSALTSKILGGMYGGGGGGAAYNYATDPYMTSGG